MRISGLSLVPVSVASVAVLFALSACGGGGGGGGSTPGDTSQALRSAAQGISISLFRHPPYYPLFQLVINNPTPGCPEVTQQGSAVSLNFGSGCYNEIIGYASGIVILEVLQSNDVRYTFINFKEGSDSEPLDGQVVFTPDSVASIREGQFLFSYNSCPFRITISESRLNFPLLSQRGTVSTSRGVFQYTAEIREFANCRWPTNGSILINNGAAQVDYLPNCGMARITIGSLSETVNLNDLESRYFPCN